MELEQLGADWETLGREDPLWAILARPDKKGNRWEEEEFFATGRGVVEDLLAYVEKCGVQVPTGTALDFGCGVGRLTQAIAEHFDATCGVDIAPSMIEAAERFNRHGARCRYRVNDHPDLGLLEDASFDFICSHLVLQHIQPHLAEGYIREFPRLLRPGGVLVFQIPSEPTHTLKGAVLRLQQRLPLLQPLLKIYRGIKSDLSPRVGMFGVRKERVLEILAEAPTTVHDVSQNRAAGCNWISYRYCVTRDPA